MVKLEYFDWKDVLIGKYCPEAVGKHCNSRKNQNTSISVVIVPLSRGNKNSIAWDSIARIFWVEWLNIRENVRLPDTEYLRFPVRKLAESFKVENISITGCRAHYNSHYGGNSDGFSHVNMDLILLTENQKKIDCRTRSIFNNLSGCRTYRHSEYFILDRPSWNFLLLFLKTVYPYLFTFTSIIFLHKAG